MARLMTPTPPVGSYLGVVATPPPATGAGPLEGVRLALLDQILCSRGDGVGGAGDWMQAWESAVNAAARALEESIDRTFAEAISVTLMPERRYRMFLPGPVDRQRWRTILDSAGIPLEEATGTMESPLGPEADLRRLGTALEASWLQLVDRWWEEWRRWTQRATAVARWRPGSRRLYLASALLLLLLGALGLAIGGIIPPPEWLRPLVDWWWSLPWP